ncbi:hypothetical protein PALU110988_28165 [Paenibacillus lupini]|uniref:hypothetical protein n=1 Tax=Paenibacillus lupini TaxID=1450204 RepID=UPI00141FEC69|nr:hypothetical protein [Paenibacillus lupini]NIK21578.1 hypothetical protein [Paenibacillus lupini]
MMEIKYRKHMPIGHFLRWLFILALVLFLIRAHYGSKPWSLESVVHQAQSSMEMPSASIASIADSGRGIQSVILLDREHSMFHHMFVARPFGMLWENRGGGFGMSLDPDVLIDFKWGMATFGAYRHYYYIGQVHDSRVAHVKVIWHDGYEQNAYLTDGVYQVARAIKRSSDDGQSPVSKTRMIAYDKKGTKLYELTPEQGEIKKTN